MASLYRRGISVVRTRLGVMRRRAALTVPIGSVDFGDLRRTDPISRVFGLDRGTPIDRYYIERFLAANASLIRGHVLEIGDRTYTKRFGARAVDESDVLHVTGESSDATIIADLTAAPQIADDTFDCIILTQMLHFTLRMDLTVAEVFRILRPGGFVLCTVPGISQISRYDMERWGDFWRLTSLSARQLFETAFPKELVEVRTAGNVLSAVAFLHGLAAAELTHAELDVEDDDYQLLVLIKAAKPK